VDASYLRFLRTGDLASWRQCLLEATEQARGPNPDARQLAQRMSIATYVAWLGALSEGGARDGDTTRLLHRCADEIGAAFLRDPSADTTYATAVVLASFGYSRSAERLLAPTVNATPPVDVESIWASDWRSNYRRYLERALQGPSDVDA